MHQAVEKYTQEKAARKKGDWENRIMKVKLAKRLGKVWRDKEMKRMIGHPHSE